MKLTAFAAAAALMLGAAVPAFAQSSRAPTDTGNMAYPAPVPQGNIATTRPTGPRTPDTGNMAYPAPLPQGNIATTRPTGPRAPTDTGNMAYPAPAPQGRVGATAPAK
jgi:hypothetical protein